MAAEHRGLWAQSPNTYSMNQHRMRELDALLREVADNPASLGALTSSLHKQGKRALAVELCVRALELWPADAELRVVAGEVFSAEVPRWHFSIVQDIPRNDAFEGALRRAITPGCKILEIGTGTGLLAMMAARAGAGEVITCEADPAIAMAAREVIARNGHADRVRVINKHSTALDVHADLGGPVDILVSEIISDNLISEGALPVIEHAALALVKPGATIIPARGRVRVALADDDEWERALMTQAAGFDLTAFNKLDRPHREFDVGSHRLTLRSEPADLFLFDFAGGGPFPEAAGAVTLTAQSRRINGVVQWIALDMDATAIYENRPEPGAGSSWFCVFHPFERPLNAAPGQQVVVRARHDRDRVRIWTDIPP